MKKLTIYYSSHFVQAFKKLHHDMQKKAVEREKLFRIDFFDPRLKTHKLKGDMADFWSFSVDYSNRIVFIFEKNGTVGFVDIGSHSIYK